MKSFKLGMALLAALVFVFAACNDGSIDEDGGNADQGGSTSGSADNTRYVSTAAELLEQNTALQDDPSLSCKLMADIDMDDIEGEWTWTPVTNYTGTFDGNEKTISNLKIETSDSYVGFLGRILSGGVVRDLGLKDIAITGNGHVGGIAGENQPINLITDCYWSGADEGIGLDDGEAAVVEVDTTRTEADTSTAVKSWVTAQDAMNENEDVKSSGWEYYNAADSTPPKLKKSGN